MPLEIVVKIVHTPQDGWRINRTRSLILFAKNQREIEYISPLEYKISFLLMKKDVCSNTDHVNENTFHQASTARSPLFRTSIHFA